MIARASCAGHIAEDVGGQVRRGICGGLLCESELPENDARRRCEAPLRADSGEVADTGFGIDEQLLRRGRSAGSKLVPGAFLSAWESMGKVLLGAFLIALFFPGRLRCWPHST